MKILINVIFSFLMIFCISYKSHAENLEFGNYRSQVSGHELDLALFDLKVNYLHLLNEEDFRYLHFITSIASSQDRINSFVLVLPSITKGKLSDKQKRLNELCNNLYKAYRERFMMIDLDYKKKPDEVGKPAYFMKPCNLKMYIHTTGTKSMFLAEWECGSLSYKEDFLK